MCSICNHKNLYQINESIADGVPLREIALTYGVHRSSLSRHQRQHVLYFAWIPEIEITKADLKRYLWQCSIKENRTQHIVCPLCDADRPTAHLNLNGVFDYWCVDCGIHSIEFVADSLGFELVPDYGYKERMKQRRAKVDRWRNALLLAYAETY